MYNIFTEKRFWVGVSLSSVIYIFYKYNVEYFFMLSILISICIYEDYNLIYNQNIRYDNKLAYFKAITILSPILLYGISGTMLLCNNYIIDKDYTLFVLATVTISDILQYYNGRYLGKIKIGFPSPNKTLEGYIIGSLTSILLSSYIFNVGAAYSGKIVLYGIIGDLTVSLFKRGLCIKDISNILGPHGGYLDRVDGIYMAFILEYISTKVLY